MVHVTLVGVRQARPGSEFVFLGLSAECARCRLRNICSNLEHDRTYRVLHQRDTVHNCPVHEDGVRAVEVGTVPFEAAVPARMAFEGGTLTYAPVVCNMIGCENHRFCRPRGYAGGGKKKVLRSVRPLECENGTELKLVLLDG